MFGQQGVDGLIASLKMHLHNYTFKINRFFTWCQRFFLVGIGIEISSKPWTFDVRKFYKCSYVVPVPGHFPHSNHSRSGKWLLCIKLHRNRLFPYTKSVHSFDEIGLMATVQRDFFLRTNSYRTTRKKSWRQAKKSIDFKDVVSQHTVHSSTITFLLSRMLVVDGRGQPDSIHTILESEVNQSTLPATTNE